MRKASVSFRHEKRLIANGYVCAKQLSIESRSEPREIRHEGFDPLPKADEMKNQIVDNTSYNKKVTKKQAEASMPAIEAAILTKFFKSGLYRPSW